MTARPAKLSPKRVWLDEKDCERLKRTEFEALRALLAAVSYTASANDDLKDRMECIPYGRERMSMVLGGLRALADDIIGTIPRGQAQQIGNTMKDMELRMVPKLTSMSQNIILDKTIAQGLYDAAMEKCHGCVEDAQGCRKCALYKVLESTLPLRHYDGLICPYSISEWE